MWFWLYFPAVAHLRPVHPESPSKLSQARANQAALRQQGREGADNAREASLTAEPGTFTSPHREP